MRKIFTAMAVSGLILLTSCGDSEKASDFAVNTAQESSYSDYSGDNYNGEEEAADEEYSENGEIEGMSNKQSTPKAIDKQMLVYSCDMSIDVLEFDKAVDQFHELINKYNGFIESETYTDGGSSTQWKYTDEKKWKVLNAVIRVPSADYDSFCKDAENVGDMRRKSASVQNLTTEYSDLKTTLSIYEAKEKRYLELLENITDENEAMAVEKELTEIQIEIARLKTRMNSIEGDVAYSYINLSLNEVREYTEEPVEIKTDTFGQRLSNTLSRTWSGFLEFMEGLLFFIIRVFPYAVVFGVFIFVISKLKKLYRHKHPKTRRPKKGEPIPPEIKPEPPVNEVVPDNTADTAETNNTENKSS